MGKTQRRVIGYGAAGAVAAGLVWAGFVYEAEPDVGTMLGSVEIQLRMAGAMPPRDKSGQEPSVRVELRAAARRYLDRIEVREPGYPPAVSYRAFLAYLDLDYGEAARLYAAVRAHAECTAELRDESILNESRMLRLAGRAADADHLLRTHAASLQPKLAAIAQRELGAR